MAPADATLIEQTLEGDLSGFGELHRRYYERVVRLVTGIVRDRVQAEDTVQDAYLSALKALPRLADRDRFYPWLCRIAVNRAIEEKRKRASRGRLHDAWTESEVTGRAAEAEPDRIVLEGLERKERSMAVHDALDRLPEGQRAAVVLRFFDHLSMRDIADVLGCEEVTARTQVFRGLQKLGKMLRALAPENASD